MAFNDIEAMEQELSRELQDMSQDPFNHGEIDENKQKKLQEERKKIFSTIEQEKKKLNTRKKLLPSIKLRILHRILHTLKKYSEQQNIHPITKKKIQNIKELIQNLIKLKEKEIETKRIEQERKNIEYFKSVTLPALIKDAKNANLKTKTNAANAGGSRKSRKNRTHKKRTHKNKGRK